MWPLSLLTSQLPNLAIATRGTTGVVKPDRIASRDIYFLITIVFEEFQLLTIWSPPLKEQYVFITFSFHI
jgi:hypothetical protein